jgi:hypothetical protein
MRDSISGKVDLVRGDQHRTISSAQKPVAFAFHDVRVTCSQDVAFAAAVGTCVDIDASGTREPLEFRLTMGLRKIRREMARHVRTSFAACRLASFSKLARYQSLAVNATKSNDSGPSKWMYTDWQSQTRH